MHQVLVYGDSLSWGIVPNTRHRLTFELRWPGVMESELQRMGVSIRVIEDCLNGRRSVWDDPYKPGRNGLMGLEQRIEINSPLSLVVLFLGTNDFQSMHQINAWQSAQGIGTLIASIRRAPIEPGMPTPEILVVAPPPFQTPKGAIAPKFVGAEDKAVGFSDALRIVARDTHCHFFDAGSVVQTSSLDGVHLDQPQHAQLGVAIAKETKRILLTCE
ncbi:MAG: SGNH/GDSL hydrolase family protein [Pirellula sp.]